MKKLTACFITAILMLVSLCACGGMGDKKCSPELGKPFTLSAEIEYEDMRAEAVFTRRDINNWEVEFSSPDTLSGIILTFKDNNVEASYNGLSFSVPKTALPMKSMISAFIGVSEKAAELGELTGEEKDNQLVVSGETELGKYLLIFDKNNALSGFEMENLKLKMKFTDFRVISGDISQKPTAEIEDITGEPNIREKETEAPEETEAPKETETTETGESTDSLQDESEEE